MRVRVRKEKKIALNPQPMPPGLTRGMREKNHAFTLARQAIEQCERLGSGEHLTRTFSVTATQTITNSDYRVSTEGNISATGQVNVITLIGATDDSRHKIYLPVILKNQ